MTCQEIMEEVLKRQTEGVMFHDQMVDYYAFLGLNGLMKIHKKQVVEEWHTLEHLKKHYIKEFCALPFYHSEYKKIIPAEWKNKTKTDITITDLKTLAKSSLDAYLSWEEETLRTYKHYATQLEKAMNYRLLHCLKNEICDVEQEIIGIKGLIEDACVKEFSPEYLRWGVDEL